MKILFISHNLNLEGASISLFNLIKDLSKSKQFKPICISSVKGPLLKEYKKIKVPVIIRNKFLQSASLTKTTIKKINPDIVVVNTIILFNLVEILHQMKKKVVWIIRESERDPYFKDYPRLNAQHFTYPSAVIFVAKATQLIYSDLNTRNNFQVINNGIDLTNIEKYKKKVSKIQLRRRMKILINKTVLVSVGTTCQRKGQIEIVKSLAYFSPKSLENLLFYVVGARNIPYLEELKYFIKLYSLSRNVKLISETPEVFKYLRLADIFISNSYIESFSRTIMEAMSFSLPIIATNIYGTPELITHRKNGYLINPGNELMLQKTIQKLLNSLPLRQSLGKQAYNTVKEKFNHSLTTNNFIKLFNSI